MCGIKILQQDFALKGGLMRGTKIPQQDFALKRQGGGLMREGGHICGTLRYITSSVLDLTCNNTRTNLSMNNIRKSLPLASFPGPTQKAGE